MFACLARERAGEPVEVRFNQRQRIAQLQHEPPVDDILARRAPMHVAFRLRSRCCNLARQRRDERNREVAGVARVARDRRKIEPVRRAFARDRVGRRGGNDADLRFRVRQRRFEVEHPRDACAVAEHVAHRVGGEQRIGHVRLPLEGKRVLSDALDDQRDALADADAHRAQRVAAAGAA